MSIKKPYLTLPAPLFATGERPREASSVLARHEANCEPSWQSACIYVRVVHYLIYEGAVTFFFEAL